MTTIELRSLLDRIMAESNYAFIGVRTQDVPFTLGAIDHTSFVWIDGEMTTESLGGICCTDATSPAVKMHCEDHGFSYYWGAHVAILGSDDAFGGEDIDELVMIGAEVIHIIK